jgi:hypothetical protein
MDYQMLREGVVASVALAGVVGVDDSSYTGLFGCPELFLLFLALCISVFLSFSCLYKNMAKPIHMPIAVITKTHNSSPMVSTLLSFCC